MIAKSPGGRSCRTSVTSIVGLLTLVPLMATEPADKAIFDSEAVVAAFAASSDGYSSDELLIRDDLRRRFLDALASATATKINADSERAALLHLLRLRKAGKLGVPVTRRAAAIDDSKAS